MIRIEFHNCITGLYKEWFFKETNPQYSKLINAINKARDWDKKHDVHMTSGLYIDADEGNCSYVTYIKNLDSYIPDFEWVRKSFANKEYHKW